MNGGAHFLNLKNFIKSIFYPKLLSFFNFNPQLQNRVTLAPHLSKTFNFDPRAISKLLKTTLRSNLNGFDG